MHLGDVLSYFREKCDLDVDEILIKNILESSDKPQILEKLAMYYVQATVIEKYRLELGILATAYRTSSEDYSYLSPQDKYDVDDIINSRYNEFSQQLELIFSEVISLLDAYYDVEDLEAGYELREKELRQIASDHTGYMSPSNPHHSITYLTPPEEKEEKLYQRLIGIVNRANGIGVGQGSDSLAVQQLNIDYIEELYEILDSTRVSKKDEVLDWLVHTQIFTDTELYRIT